MFSTPQSQVLALVALHLLCIHCVRPCLEQYSLSTLQSLHVYILHPLQLSMLWVATAIFHSLAVFAIVEVGLLHGELVCELCL